MTWLDDVANGLSDFVSNLGKASGNTAAKADKSTAQTSTKKKHRVSTKNTISANDIANAGKATGKAVSSAASNASKTTGATAAKAESRDWQASGGKVGGGQASVLNDQQQRLQDAVNQWQEDITNQLGEPDKYAAETRKERGEKLDTEQRKKDAEENLSRTQDYEAHYDEYLEQTKQDLIDGMVENGWTEDDAKAFLKTDEGQAGLNAETLRNMYYDFAPITSEGIYISPGNKQNYKAFLGKDVSDLEQMWEEDVAKATSEDAKERAGWQISDEDYEKLAEQGITLDPELLELQRAAKEGNSSDTFIIGGIQNPGDQPGFNDYEKELYFADLSETEGPEKYDEAMDAVDEDYHAGRIDEATWEHLKMTFSTMKHDAEELEKQEELDPGSWQVDLMGQGVRPEDIKAAEDYTENAKKDAEDLTTFYSGKNPDATDEEIRAMVDEQLENHYGTNLEEIESGALDNLSDQDYQDIIYGDRGGSMTQGHTYTPSEKVDVTKDAKVANIGDDIKEAYESYAQYYKGNNPDATDEEVEKNANEATASQYGVSYDDFSNYSDKEVEQYKKDVANGKVDGTMLHAHQVEQPTDLTKNYSGLAGDLAQAFEKYVGFDQTAIQDYIDAAEAQGDRFIPADIVDNANNTRGEMMAQALADQVANPRSIWTDQAEYNYIINPGTEDEKVYDYADLIDKDTGESLVDQDIDNNTGFVLSDGTYLPWGTATGDYELSVDDDGNYVFNDDAKTKLTPDQLEEYQKIFEQARQDSKDQGISLGKALQNASVIRVKDDDYINFDDFYNNASIQQTEESKGPFGLGTVDPSGAYNPLSEDFNAEDLLPAILDTAGNSAAFMAAMGLGNLIPIPGAGTLAGIALTQPQRSLRGKGLDNDTLDTDSWSFSSEPYRERQREYGDFADIVDAVSEGITGVAGNTAPQWIRRAARKSERPTAKVKDTNGDLILAHEPWLDESGDLIKGDDSELIKYAHDSKGNTILNVDENGAPILDYQGRPTVKIANDSPIDYNYMVNEPPDWTERFNDYVHSLLDRSLGKTRFGGAANTVADMIQTAVEEGSEELFSGVADQWDAAASNGIDIKDAFKNYDPVTGEYDPRTSQADVVKNILNTELMNFGAGATLGGLFGAGKPLKDNLSKFFKKRMTDQGVPEPIAQDAADKAANEMNQGIDEMAAEEIPAETSNDMYTNWLEDSYKKHRKFNR